MIDEIILSSILLLSIMILFLIVFSLNNIKSHKEFESQFKKNNYVLSGNTFLLIVLIGIYNITFYKMLDTHMDQILIYIITIFGANALMAIIGILPILSLSNNHPNKVTDKLKYLILFISYVFIGFSVIYLAIRKLVYKPSKIKMTEDEFLDIIDDAELQDGINESEKDLIKSVLDFDNLKVLDIYTPRIDIVSIEDTMTTKDIVSTFKKSGLSRLPVYSKNIDTIIGTINHKDFYNTVLLDKKPLESIIQKPVEVPEYMAAKNLLSLLKTNQSHMAIVKDEYGGTLGIITMEDVLEELVGDIFDEHDKVSINIRKLNERSYIVLGAAYLDELDEFIEEIDLSELDEEDYLTVNGWVLSSLGKMGKPGDTFTYKNMVVIVKKSTNKMILEVEITVLDNVIEENNE